MFNVEKSHSKIRSRRAGKKAKILTEASLGLDVFELS